MSMRGIIAVFSALIFSAWTGATGAAEWHVKGTGTAGGSGSDSSPWDLQTALNHPASVHAGDTIWVHGGEYSGPSQFVSKLNGTSASRIVVRNYNNERARIKAGMDIGFGGTATSYATFWGLEVNDREKTTGTDGFSISNGSGANTPGIKVINCIVHDNSGSGFGYWGGAGDSELHGNIVCNNGFDSDHGHCHGFYVQNLSAPKLIKNNIEFRAFFDGTQLYTQGGHTNNVTYEGNTLFNNAEPSLITSENHTCVGYNYIVGWSYVVSQNPKMIDNCAYASPWATKGGYNMIWNTTNAVVTGNYFIGPSATASGIFNTEPPNTGMTCSNNTIYGEYTGPTGSGNVQLTARPTSTKIFIRKNDYEPTRANVTIYNWPKTNTVAVDVSTFLTAGDAYEVRDAQNWYATTPVQTGTYAGGSISIPMTGLTVAPYVGLSAAYTTPPHTAPEFAVFVVQKTGTGSAVVYGDANGDGVFGMADINTLVDWILGRKTPPAAGSAAFIASDVTGDGKVDMQDLNSMVDRLLGRITKFPVEP
jgi:hypothetical protein